MNVHSRWSLHPEIRAVLDALPPTPFEASDIDAAAIPAIRKALQRPVDVPPGLQHTQHVVERGADTPPLGLHVFALGTEGRGSGKALSAEGRRPGLVWIHGGGYMIGSASDAGRILHWVRAGYVVVAPEYRLAPEHPFPAGLQDCMDGLEETVRRAADLGLDADRLVVAGGSAGGGLAAALALRCPMSVSRRSAIWC